MAEKYRRWRLRVEPSAQNDIDKLLSGKDEKAVFNSIERLLEADDPYRVPGVIRISSGKYRKMWRQRKGNWRIIFYTQPGQVLHQGHVYKGVLHLVAVRRRSEDTYN